MRRWLLWCFERRARAAVACATIFIVAKSSKCVNDSMLNWKMKSWTVTRVIKWLLWEHGIEASKDWVFVAYTFTQHHDADAVHKCTCILWSPGATFLKQTGWYEPSGFEFSISGQLCIQNITHAYLFAKCTTHLKPLPCAKRPRSERLDQQYS